MDVDNSSEELSSDDSVDQAELEVALYSQIHFHSVDDIDQRVGIDDWNSSNAENAESYNTNKNNIVSKKRNKLESSLNSSKIINTNVSKKELSKNQSAILFIPFSDKSTGTADVLEKSRNQADTRCELDSRGFISLSSNFENKKGSLHRPKTVDVVYNQMSDTETCQKNKNEFTPDRKKIYDITFDAPNISFCVDKSNKEHEANLEEVKVLSAKKMAIIKELKEVEVDQRNESQEEEETSDELVEEDVTDCSEENTFDSDSSSSADPDMLAHTDPTLEFNLEDDGKSLLKECLPEGIDQDKWKINDEDKNKVITNISRYFCPKTIQCRNCKEEGHMSRDCPQPLKKRCIFCAQVGHVHQACPDAICFKCNAPGHRAKDCRNPRQNSRYPCERCWSTGHLAQICPDVWRQFHLTISPGIVKHHEPSEYREDRVNYCYNCGLHGHLGYECKENRMNPYVPTIYPFVARYDIGDKKLYSLLGWKKLLKKEKSRKKSREKRSLGEDLRFDAKEERRIAYERKKKRTGKKVREKREFDIERSEEYYSQMDMIPRIKNDWHNIYDSQEDFRKRPKQRHIDEWSDRKKRKRKALDEEFGESSSYHVSCHEWSDKEHQRKQKNAWQPHYERQNFKKQKKRFTEDGAPRHNWKEHENVEDFSLNIKNDRWKFKHQFNEEGEYFKNSMHRKDSYPKKDFKRHHKKSSMSKSGFKQNNKDFRDTVDKFRRINR